MERHQTIAWLKTWCRWYTYHVETIVHNVRDLNTNERSAVERLVGHTLRENQQLVIKVVNLALETEEPGNGTGEDRLPDWCNVYEGLSDDEIAILERAISRRLDLTRPTT